MDSKAKFERFYAENLNVAKEVRAQIRSHPVKKDVLETWTNDMLAAAYRLREPNLAEFVVRFKTAFRNVSSKEFFDTMDRVVDDMLDATRASAAVRILMIQTEVAKSSIWFCILYWHRIRDRIDYVLTPKNAKSIVSELKKSHARFEIFYLDDAAFSGHQLINTIRPAVRDASFKIYMLVPFISSTAKKNLKHAFSNNFLWFSPRAQTFSPLYVEGKEEHRLHLSGKNTSRFWFDYFHNHFTTPPEIPNLCALYFDHKLPDNISVYTQIIALAPAVQKDDTVKLLGGFISGCDFSTENMTPLEALSTQVHTADKALCPLPVYKKIHYMFNGEDAKPCFVCGELTPWACPCTTVAYCGRACQALDWDAHKKIHAARK